VTSSRVRPSLDPLSGTAVDRTVPHSARVWNYWLGGRDHFAVDRAAGDAWIAVQPQITRIARTGRAFLRRVVEHQVREAGIRQFLDIGTGLPTADSTHEVAQRLAPETRVVYVDNDPVVLAHAQALLTSGPRGTTHYLLADMNDPDGLIADATAALDLDQPVGVQLIGALGHVPQLDTARRLVRGLMDRMAGGSHLTIADGSLQDRATLRAQEEYARTGAVPYRNRSPDEIAGLFEGLEWVEPGLVEVTRWRPDPTDGEIVPVDLLGGLARKPGGPAVR
jgi:hypothetical protein